MLTTIFGTTAVNSITALAALTPIEIAAALGALTFGVGGLAFISFLTSGRALAEPTSVNTATTAPVYKAAA